MKPSVSFTFSGSIGARCLLLLSASDILHKWRMQNKMHCVGAFSSTLIKSNAFSLRLDGILEVANLTENWSSWVVLRTVVTTWSADALYKWKLRKPHLVQLNFMWLTSFYMVAVCLHIPVSPKNAGPREESLSFLLPFVDQFWSQPGCCIWERCGGVAVVLGVLKADTGQFYMRGKGCRPGKPNLLSFWNRCQWLSFLTNLALTCLSHHSFPFLKTN